MKNATKANLEVLFPAREIAVRVQALAADISRHYPDGVLLVGVLKGACFFLADLARQLTVPVEIDFVGISSYGSGTTSNGQPKITHFPRIPLQNRDVLIVEDILDTGTSLYFLGQYFNRCCVKSVHIAALLNKAARRSHPIDADYCGFEIEDKFVVGYGLDYDEKYRQLPDICVLKEASRGE